ncbi:hypothetical protein NB689_003181 [Xanthomonas sacchari]|nr:hypothetical protein [Xanthomonas sacchari]
MPTGIGIAAGACTRSQIEAPAGNPCGKAITRARVE